jgi:hypothetical protein
VKLEYFWTDCPDGSHVAVNYTVWEGRISGSVRKWSRDTRVNVGRLFDIGPGEIGRDDDGTPVLVLEGICAEPLRIPLDPVRIRQAEAEGREAGSSLP